MHREGGPTNSVFLGVKRGTETTTASSALHAAKYTVSRSSFSVHMVQTCINVHLQILAHPLSVANALFMTGAIISLIEPRVYDFVHTYYS